MTKNKILLIFFSLVFGFCVFADTYNCSATKSQITLLLNGSLDHFETIVNYTDSIVENSSDPTIDYWAGSIQIEALDGLQKVARAQGLVDSIPCSSNDTCSVDLYPLVQICSNIYHIVDLQYQSLRVIESDADLSAAYLAGLYSTVSGDLNSGFYVNVFDSLSLSALSNLNYTVSINLSSISNQLSQLNENVDWIYNDFYDFIDNINTMVVNIKNNVANIYTYIRNISSRLDSIYTSISNYLSYLKTISDDLKLITTNGTYNIDQSYTNQLYSSSLLGFDRFRYYAQGQLNNTQPSLYPLSPYDSLQHLRNATIYDAISSGFTSLLISQGSINNYLYWLKAIAGSNRLEAVEAHLVAVSNLVGRLDDYVLGDFSNEVSRLVETLSYVTNRVDYTTNFVHLAELVETNNTFLSSIDSKLDVLDYIKILSTTPLSSYSGDIDYYDYLTNLYINGSADSGVASTNWFERMEILLASLVFGDSGGSSISNEVEFTNFSEETIENAFNDYTFQNELTSGISLVEDTGENFLTILRGFHNSLSSISQPQSIAIGIGGLDGQDTLTYQDVMHHHFQVSFSSGASDNFTLIVRSMTTIIWILVTMMFVYFSARWLLSKVLFFYRLMRTLITSLFLK